MKPFHTADLPMEVRTKISSEFIGAENAWWVRDITSSYPWLKDARLIWILDDGSSKTVVIHIAQAGETVILSRKEGFDKIYSLLESHFGKFPLDDQERHEMLDLIKDWAVEPGAYIGSARFLAENEPFLEQWLSGKIKDTAVFKKYCVEPKFSVDDQKNSWVSSFYVFKPNGGIDSVVVQGHIKPFKIDSVGVEVAENEGSFSFPYEF